MLGPGVKISRGEFIQFAINKFLSVNKIQIHVTLACTVSTLSTEPSPQSNSTLLLNLDHAFEMLASSTPNLNTIFSIKFMFFCRNPFYSFTHSTRINQTQNAGSVLSAGSSGLKKRHTSSAGL